MFSGQVKKITQSIIAKNGPITQFQPKWQSFKQTTKVIFSQKNHFLFTAHIKKLPHLVKLSFWPIFGNLAQRHFSDLARKQKVIFLHKHYFLLMMQSILVYGKISCSTISNPFCNILLVHSTNGDLNEDCFGPSSRFTFRFCGSRVQFIPLYSNFSLAYCV